MTASLDVQVATTLARATRDFRTGDSGARAGAGFEHHLFQALLDVHPWRHAAGPDQFDMVGRVHSRTGTHYEYDGAFETGDTLYVVEAKRLANVTREHISIFIMKMIDMLLGSAEDIGHLTVKPLFASALPRIDRAAWTFAASWGILIISPESTTPHEISAQINESALPTQGAVQLKSECETIAPLLWRPLNLVLSRSDTLRFTLDSSGVFDVGRVGQVLDAWHECSVEAAYLGFAPHKAMSRPQ